MKVPSTNINFTLKPTMYFSSNEIAISSLKSHDDSPRNNLHSLFFIWPAQNPLCTIHPNRIHFILMPCSAPYTLPPLPNEISSLCCSDRKQYKTFNSTFQISPHSCLPSAIYYELVLICSHFFMFWIFCSHPSNPLQQLFWTTHNLLSKARFA